VLGDVSNLSYISPLNFQLRVEYRLRHFRRDNISQDDYPDEQREGNWQLAKSKYLIRPPWGLQEIRTIASETLSGFIARQSLLLSSPGIGPDGSSSAAGPAESTAPRAWAALMQELAG